MLFYLFRSVTREALRLPFLNGSRDRFDVGNDVLLLRLLGCFRLAGLVCRDDAFDDAPTVVWADLFGIFD